MPNPYYPLSIQQVQQRRELMKSRFMHPSQQQPQIQPGTGRKAGVQAQLLAGQSPASASNAARIEFRAPAAQESPRPSKPIVVAGNSAVPLPSASGARQQQQARLMPEFTTEEYEQWRREQDQRKGKASIGGTQHREQQQTSS
jgi:hypothetical protein